MNNKEQQIESNTEAVIDGNTLINEICNYEDIEQGKFFINEGLKFCRFGY
jgi:hypothetical protein